MVWVLIVLPDWFELRDQELTVELTGHTLHKWQDGG